MSRHAMTTWASLSRRALLAALAVAFCLFACAPALAFVFENPNAAAACGCGESFTTDAAKVA